MTKENGQHPLTAMLAANYVKKDATNQHQRYTYASAKAVSQKIAPALAEAGLYVHAVEMGLVPSGPGGELYGEIQGRNSTMRLATVTCKVTLADADGNLYGPYEGLGSGADTGDKAVMKAETAAFKYAISRASCTSWGDDPEADHTVDRETSPGEHEKSVDFKTADAASQLKRDIERAADGGTESFREAWKKADKNLLQIIQDNQTDWVEILKGKASLGDGNKKIDDKIAAEDSTPLTPTG